MKRTITITGLILILAGLITLSGCDAILEAFYPEFGDQGGEGSNTIGLWAEFAVPGGNVADPEIAVKVIDMSGNALDFQPNPQFVWPAWNWDNEGNLILSAYIELYGLPSDTDFQIFVWLERYGNNEPESDEPQTYAFWYPYTSEPNMTEDVFWFPNDIGTWVEAEAFDGLGVNYQFKAVGPFVIDTTNTGTSKQYTLTPADSSRQIYDYSWDLYADDSAYTWISGAWQEASDPTSASFNIDYSTVDDGSALPDGDYWLEVGIGYVSGQYRWKRIPVRIIDEANNGSNYDLTITIWGTDWDPVYLMDGTTYDVQVKVLDATGGADEDFVTSVTPEFGEINLTISGLSYDDTTFDGDGVDWFEIVIDADESYDFGPGDFRVAMPIGLSADEALYYQRDMFIDAWDMRPVF